MRTFFQNMDRNFADLPATELYFGSGGGLDVRFLRPSAQHSHSSLKNAARIRLEVSGVILTSWTLCCHYTLAGSTNAIPTGRTNQYPARTQGKILDENAKDTGQLGNCIVPLVTEQPLATTRRQLSREQGTIIFMRRITMLPYSP